MTLDRRNFIKLLGGASSLAMAACAGTGGALSGPTGGRRVVVVGGGYGGTIAAKYIRMLDSSIEVILIERNDHYVSCPFSNLYIAGALKDLTPLTIRYDKLTANHGIKFVQAEVVKNILII